MSSIPRLYINPGHSDKDPGAVGYETERDLNVRTAKFMDEHLRKNYIVETKVTDGSINDTRIVCKEANAWKAGLFVSIHNNAGGGDGWEGLVYSAKRKALGQIFEKHVKAAGQNSRGVKYRPGLNILALTDMPAILCEGAFVDNKKDIEDWNDDSELEKLGIAYAEAAAEYQKLERKLEEPEDTIPDKEYIYRVQVGAYSKLSGAQKELARLREAGFGGIIVKSEK